MKKSRFIHSTLFIEFPLFASNDLSVSKLFKSEQNRVLVLMELKF